MQQVDRKSTSKRYTKQAGFSQMNIMSCSKRYLRPSRHDLSYIPHKLYTGLVRKKAKKTFLTKVTYTSGEHTLAGI